MIALALILAAQSSAQPTAEALALGRDLAEKGTLAAMLPVLEQQETAAMIAAHPELSAADKAALTTTAHQVFTAGRDRLLAADARSYADHLSVADLRVLVAASNTPAAARLRAAMPAIIVQTTSAIGAVDFKGEVAAAFCKSSGKLCQPAQ
ncbi:hypothetical protein ABDK56_12365 [Sphingomonas sp. ASV193]|uniref:hypothetical protein n=1 Tax=Sphingomonas sp. ASV193 TaxID=3144405 RepID=UPI0032E91B45